MLDVTLSRLANHNITHQKMLILIQSSDRGFWLRIYRYCMAVTEPGQGACWLCQSQKSFIVANLVLHMLLKWNVLDFRKKYFLYRFILFPLFFHRWPVYSAGIVAGFSYLTTALTAYTVRRRLKLYDINVMVSYVLSPVGPTLLAGLFHSFIVTEKIIEGEFFYIVFS